MSNKQVIFIMLFVLLAISATGLFSCKPDYVPKPMAYHRIDLPEKKYERYDSTCPYSFEYPVYGTLKPYERDSTKRCWMNLEFEKYNGTIYLTYHPVHNNLAQHAEDARKLVYKHAVKAESIPEKVFSNPSENVHGILYDIKGNTATSVVFFVTDSIDHFLYGALYFNTMPNKDSLAPVIDFFRADVIHMMETMEWR